MRDRVAQWLRASPVSVALALVLLTVYLASAFRAGVVWEIPADALLRDGASYGPALAAGEWWRVVSAAFLHGGALHLLVNLVVLADAAPLVEAGGATADRPPPLLTRLRRVIGVFIVTAAGGFVASAWWSSGAVSIGASGGILGFYGYWLARVWRMAGQRADQPRRFGPVLARRHVALAAGYLAAAVTAGFLIPGVDNAAHIGGLLGGAVLGWMPTANARASTAVAQLVLVSAALLAMPAQWAADYRAQQHFNEIYSRFVERDRQANAEIRRLLGEIRAGRDPAAVAGEFDRLVAGRLRENRQLWLDQSADDGSSALAIERQRWQRYGDLRVDAAESLVAALLAPDGATQARELGRFERAMREARAIAEEANSALDKP
ncbi:MAG TPA: rhomboid family intramembrane serine protease [Rhodocyclaceae bacterium]